MNFTSSRWLPMVLLTGSNLFLPFAWASKPAGPSAGGAAESSPL
jgi:uncharacterized protein (DUF486 family)